jgi:protein-S-isoprenylcysteine O-methyltransferase Ste14
LQIILSYGTVALSVACSVSFSWAIARLFATPTHLSLRMKLLGLAGLLFSLVQIAMITLTAVVYWRRMTALVLYIVALGLFWWAVPQAAKTRLNIAFVNAVPATLIFEGPYAYIRHPFYTSYLLYWMAGAVITSWLWASVFVMGWFYFTAIRQEEQGFRCSPLATAYEVYRSQTGALLPLLRVSKRK